VLAAAGLVACGSAGDDHRANAPPATVTAQAVTALATAAPLVTAPGQLAASSVQLASIQLKLTQAGYDVTGDPTAPTDEKSGKGVGPLTVKIGDTEVLVAVYDDPNVSAHSLDGIDGLLVKVSGRHVYGTEAATIAPADFQKIVEIGEHMATGSGLTVSPNADVEMICDRLKSAGYIVTSCSTDDPATSGDPDTLGIAGAMIAGGSDYGMVTVYTLPTASEARKYARGTVKDVYWKVVGTHVYANILMDKGDFNALVATAEGR
jgi:hypothetical protein